MGRPFLTPLLLSYHQATPPAPASGHLALYSRGGGVLYTQNPSGSERLVSPGLVFAFSKAGDLAVEQGAHRIYNDTGGSLTIWSVRASVGTASAGAPIIVDVNIGSNPTTIFTNQANRPTINAGASSSGRVTNMDVVIIPDGGFFVVDVDQVGSTTPGADLTVQILCR